MPELLEKRASRPAGQQVGRRRSTHELAIVIVSMGDADWLRPCLTTVFQRAGGLELDVVVVENGPAGETTELIVGEFPAVRLIESVNLGFSHGNNEALIGCDARYVLFLNPDTELVSGNLAHLVAELDERPEVGLAGVRHLTRGSVYPTMRRFPNALRSLGGALGIERSPVRPSWLCERVLDISLYERETECDWTVGAFMIARREALEAAGLFDERFFLYSEETDLCLRIKRAGWEVHHLPLMTIIHHAGRGGVDPRMEAQNTYSRVQYARKHFSPLHRGAYWLTLVLGSAVRWVLAVGAADQTGRKVAGRILVTLTGREPPPFGYPPAVAVSSREGERERDELAGDRGPALARTASDR